MSTRYLSTAAVLLFASCVTSERPEPAPVAESVTVLENDDAFRALEADLARFEVDQREEWKTIHVERDFKEEKRFHGSLAVLFPTLADEEKKALLAWLSANPLGDSDQELVARVTLGDEEALEEVVAVLRSGEGERLAEVLWYLGWFDWKGVPRLFEQRESLLLPLLDHPDRTVVARLTMSLEKHEEAFWWEAVRSRLMDRRYPNKSALVGVLKRSSSPDVVDLLSGALVRRGREDNPSLFLYALQELTKREDASPELRAKAEEALFAAVEADPVASESAYYHLFQHDPERALPLAEKYLFHLMKQEALEKDFPASFVLREWARRRGKDHEELLRSWTSHARLGRSALEALTELHAGSGDESLVALWQEQAGASGDRYIYHQVAAIGGDRAKALALQMLQRSGISPEREIGFLWRLRDVTLETALQVSVENGLLPAMPSQQVQHDALLENDPLGSPYGHWMGNLTRAGRAAHFDTETSTFPNRHDELITNDLKKAGGGVFQPGRAVEVWRQDGEYYDVAFEHGSKWYHFRAQGLGDWYDVDSVLAAVNRALADAGRPERFHVLPTGGQDAFLLFATRESFEAVTRELMLPTSTDPDSARALGKAFEEEVFRRLGVKER